MKGGPYQSEMNIEAVAFDLDGTLYPDVCMYARSIPLFAMHPLFIYNFNKMRREIRKLDRIDDFRATQAELLASRMGIPRERAAALIEEIIYEKWPAYFKGMKTFPYVKETLLRLKADGFKLGLLSDFPLQTKLSILGLENIWDCSVSSDTVNYLKPSPAPFNFIQERLGVPFGRILYVGDRYAYDVVGAKRAGMLAALFTKKKAAVPLADFTFSDYRDLYGLIVNKKK
jgi:putative hydrolase of the HAD superfamily